MIVNRIQVKAISLNVILKSGCNLLCSADFFDSDQFLKAQITQVNLQRNFITQIANTNSLQKIIQSDQSNMDQKQAATYTLLSKSLAHQQFELFKQSYAFMPKNAAQYKGYNSDNEPLKNKPDFSNFIWNGTNITSQLKCSNLETLVSQLAQTPKDLLLNVCLGEYFLSAQGYSLQQLSYSEQQTSSFDGKVFIRGQIYQDLIKSPSKGDLQAYALYRAIQCYAPSGINDCVNSSTVSLNDSEGLCPFLRNTSYWAAKIP